MVVPDTVVRDGRRHPQATKAGQAVLESRDEVSDSESDRQLMATTAELSGWRRGSVSVASFISHRTQLNKEEKPSTSLLG